MEITPNKLTLGQLFNISNEQFFIPAYQRRYAWELKQLEALFNDINFLNPDDSHLLGTILFLTQSHVPGVNKLELVDGQQRITSLTILLKVIRDNFIKLGYDDEANEIKKYLSCKGVEKSTKNKLELGDLDNSDYEKLFSDEDLDKIQNKNLLYAYSYFSKRAEDLGNKLKEFYEKLVNKVVVIRLDIGEARDAYKLFETINNRGLKLTVTDIIKNFILGHASLIDDKTLNKVKNNWRDLIINLDNIDSDKFFRHFMMGKLKVKIPVSRLTDEFKHYYYINIVEANLLSDYNAHFELVENNGRDEESSNDEEEISSRRGRPKHYPVEKMSILDFSNILTNNSLIYSKIIKKSFDNSIINEHLTNLSYIESAPADTFLLTLFQNKVSDNDIIEILKILETFMLRRHICKSRTSELDDIFSKMVALSAINITESVKKFLKEHLPNNQEFLEKFSDSNFKGLEGRAKYVLRQLEYKFSNSEAEWILRLGAEVHLEHIIPLTITTQKAKKEFGDWVSYLGPDATERHKDYVWKIGNLTLLASELNIRASNNPYRAKVKEYEKSKITLNKIIVEKYKRFKFKEVERRSDELAEEAFKIWKF